MVDWVWIIRKSAVIQLVGFTDFFFFISEDLLETHEGVTILFADIVNYTVMTKQLNINDLLEVLNELFGRFDDASDVSVQILIISYNVQGVLSRNKVIKTSNICQFAGIDVICHLIVGHMSTSLVGILCKLTSPCLSGTMVCNTYFSLLIISFE